VSIFAAAPRADRDSWVRSYGVGELLRYESELLDFARQNHGDLLATIRDTGKLESDTETKLIAMLDAFAGIFQPSSTGSGAA
jgi:F-type H+-transporting ATPase subunit alpha